MDPSSTLLVPRVQLIYLAFSALPHARLLARRFQASRSIIVLLIIMMGRVYITQIPLPIHHLASILQIIKPCI